MDLSFSSFWRTSSALFKFEALINYSKKGSVINSSFPAPSNPIVNLLIDLNFPSSSVAVGVELIEWFSSIIEGHAEVLFCSKSFRLVSDRVSLWNFHHCSGFSFSFSHTDFGLKSSFSFWMKESFFSSGSWISISNFPRLLSMDFDLDRLLVTVLFLFRWVMKKGTFDLGSRKLFRDFGTCYFQRVLILLTLRSYFIWRSFS